MQWELNVSKNKKSKMLLKKMNQEDIHLVVKNKLTHVRKIKDKKKTPFLININSNYDAVVINDINEIMNILYFDEQLYNIKYNQNDNRNNRNNHNKNVQFDPNINYLEDYALEQERGEKINKPRFSRHEFEQTIRSRNNKPPSLKSNKRVNISKLDMDDDMKQLMTPEMLDKDSDIPDEKVNAKLEKANQEQMMEKFKRRQNMSREELKKNKLLYDEENEISDNRIGEYKSMMNEMYNNFQKEYI